MPWIDTHCHLDATEFDADRDAVHAAAQAVGVRTLLVPAVSIATFPAVQATCQRYPGCHPAYGIHPLYTPTASLDQIEQLRDWLRREPAIAVGEIGLDGFVPGLDWAQQEALFVAQLQLARELNLPVILHVRRAIDQVLKHLRRIPVPGGIAHAFNGSRQQADTFIALGFTLGFGGTLTYPGSSRIRELARTLPLDSLVLETDAPDIPPSFSPRSEPAFIPRYATELAALRGITLDEVATATTANTHRTFPRLMA